jgi:hypothetical protein
MNISGETRFNQAEIESIQVGTKLIYSDAANYQKWFVIELFDGGFAAKDDYETKDFWFDELQNGWSIS